MFQKKFLQSFKNIIKDVHSKKSNVVISSCSRCLYLQTFQKSIEQPERFWDEVAQDITWFKKYTQVLDDSKQPFTKWFVGGELNTCYEALDKHVDDGFGDQTAFIYDSPVANKKQRLSYKKMKEEASKFARVLLDLGVTKGDRVVIYMPMIPEALIAIYGCARIGAIHSVVFGGFASMELARRIDDAKPVVIVTASCGIEPKRIVPYEPLINEALQLASQKPKKIITVSREERDKIHYDKEVDIDWNDVMSKVNFGHDCVPVDANDPIYILYTSGTTGSPKGIVRPSGGHAVALKWTLKHMYNINAGDVWWTASDIGWVVGHSYIVYAPLLNRCTSVFFEGKPVGCPDASTFFRVINEYDVKALFTAPTAIRVIKNEDPEGRHAEKFQMKKLESLFLAGENADLVLLEWATKVFKSAIIDHWWQTESGWPISNHHLGLNLPNNYKFGSVGKPSPGWNVKVLNKGLEECKPGELGQIFVKLPLPPGSLATLWNNDERFLDSYFRRAEGYYDSCDAGTIDENGYLQIGGRLDDVINVAGHRLSTKQMEMAVAKHDDVFEEAVIGVKDEVKGLIPVGLIVLAKSCKKSEGDVIKDVINMVRKDIGPVAAFKKVIVLPTIPKTRAGKFIRGTLKKILDGDEYTIPRTIENIDDFAKVEAILKNVKFD